MNPLSEYWITILNSLCFAFQPIVNIHSGSVYGFEALLRGLDGTPFKTIPDVFDAAFKEGLLYAFDYHLREKALILFKELGFCQNVKLFYNLDNRLTEMEDYSPGNTMMLLARLGLDPSSIVFEVSERHQFSDYSAAQDVLTQYKGQNFRIALDDFGTGFSGLQLLYYAEPDILKIDRFFIDGIDTSPRKHLFAERIVSMAHSIGLHVVAEGVETEQEFHACRKIGCDLVQGYLISKPTTKLSELHDRYQLVTDLVQGDRRNGHRAKSVEIEALISKIDSIKPIYVGASILEILDRFRGENAPAIIPILETKGECIGMLHERDFRKYVYSPYGISLLQHEATTMPFAGLLSTVPICDVSVDITTIQELFLSNPLANGVLIYEDGVYLGLLDARSILAIVSEKELLDARDQNPLTRLPGNVRIEQYFEELKTKPGFGTYLCYFDINDFKPFNDFYGFRRGDRVILLFADILRDYAIKNDWFIGHIGGDDFFAGITCLIDEDSSKRYQNLENLLHELLDRFTGSVGSFYDEADRRQGWIEITDRNDTLRKFPVLTASVGVFHIKITVNDTDDSDTSFERMGEELAALKKQAKSVGGYAYKEGCALQIKR